MSEGKLNRTWLLWLVPIVGFIAVLKATSYFIGISADSTFYISAAESLRSTGELRSIYEGSHMEYLSHYPPGYSVILYLINLVCNDLYEAARWCNAIFFSALLYLIGFVLRNRVSILIALLSQLFILTSASVFLIFEMAWSEPSYLFFSFLAMYMLYKFSEERKFEMKWLLLSALFISISISIRYIGVTLVLASTLILWNVLAKEGLWKRIKLIAIHGFISSLTLVLWMLRNIILIDKPTDRHFEFHPMPFQYYDDWFSSTRKFFLDVSFFPDSYSMIGGGIIVLILLLVAISVWRKHKFSIESFWFQFAWVYLGFLIFSNTFLDFTPMYFRTLSPPYILIFVALVVYFFNKTRGKQNLVLIGLFGILVSLQSYAFSKRIKEPDYGNDLSARNLVSEISIQKISEIPANARVYTNCADMIYLLDNGRKSDWWQTWNNEDTTDYYDVLFTKIGVIDEYLIETSEMEFEIVYESDDLLIRKHYYK